MRTTIGLRVGLLLAVIALVPTMARSQDSTGYSPPDPDFPFPLNNHLDQGGFYGAGEFLLFRTNRNLSNQPIAIRGFTVTDGELRLPAGTPTPVTIPLSERSIDPQTHIGQFIGPQSVALTANSFGNETAQPGFSIYLGYKFQDGVALDVAWWHLSSAKYSGGASFAPGVQTQANLSDTFLSSAIPISGFSPEFAGPDVKVTEQVRDANGNLVTAGIGTVGIWNAASIMQVFYTQRFDEWNVNGRFPIFETENTRTYGIMGPRLSWIWDRFKWRTVSIGSDGNVSDTDVAIYSNTVSNRLYGIHFGCGTEWRLGDTPIGTFACTLELQAATMVDIVKQEGKYELQSRTSSSKEATREYNFVPEVQGTFGITWYPIEGIQVRIGYDAMAFFNTVGIEDPVSFSFATIKDQTKDGEFRFFQGIRAGLGFAF